MVMCAKFYQNWLRGLGGVSKPTHRKTDTQTDNGKLLYRCRLYKCLF